MGSFVKQPLMLPLAALASGEALWTAGAERAREGALERQALAAARRRYSARGAAVGEACSHAIDASDGLPEDTSADEYIRSRSS